MSDLAKRARDEANRDDHRGAGLILRQCADEIERLEKLVSSLEQIILKNGTFR